MSIALTMIVKDMNDKQKKDTDRLDKLEDAVKLLRKELRAYERAPMSKRGVKVPPVPLPDTLEKLEIGKQPEGT